MRRAFLASAVLAGALLAVGCSDQRSPLPTGPSISPNFTIPSSCPKPLELAQLTAALFAPKDLLAFALQLQNTINLKMSKGDVAGAQKVVLAFIDFTLTSYYQGKLRDPNGANPPTTQEAVIRLIDGLLCWVGLPPSGIVLGPPGTTGSPVTTKVIGAGGGSLVATDNSGSGYAALSVPPGTVSADRLWVITRRDDLTQQNCVTTGLEQTGLCIDFSVVPAQDLLKPVTVEICQLNGNEGLQLAHQLPQGKVELLVRLDPVPISLPCPHSFSPAPPRGLGSIGRAVWRVGSFVARVLGPKPAFAGHSGLGGLVAPKLSNVTAVQMGPIDFETYPSNGAATCHVCGVTNEFAVSGVSFQWQSTAFPGTTATLADGNGSQYGDADNLNNHFVMWSVNSEGQGQEGTLTMGLAALSQTMEFDWSTNNDFTTFPVTAFDTTGTAIPSSQITHTFLRTYTSVGGFTFKWERVRITSTSLIQSVVFDMNGIGQLIDNVDINPMPPSP